MSALNHTPISDPALGQPPAPDNAGTFNTPFGQLDAAIGDLSAAQPYGAAPASAAAGLHDAFMRIGNLDNLAEAQPYGSNPTTVAGALLQAFQSVGFLSNLATTAKNNVITALNEVRSQLLALIGRVDTAHTSGGDLKPSVVANSQLANDVKVGSLAALTVGASSVTNALNAQNDRLAAKETEINTARNGEASLGARIGGINDRLTAKETEITTARSGETSLGTRIGGINDRLTAKETEIAAARGTDASLGAHIDGINARLVARETELAAAREGSATIGARIDSGLTVLDERISAYEDEIEDARGGSSSLDERIEDLEYTLSMKGGGAASAVTTAAYSAGYTGQLAVGAIGDLQAPMRVGYQTTDGNFEVNVLQSTPNSTHLTLLNPLVGAIASGTLIELQNTETHLAAQSIPHKAGDVLNLIEAILSANNERINLLVYRGLKWGAGRTQAERLQNRLILAMAIADAIATNRELQLPPRILEIEYDADHPRILIDGQVIIRGAGIRRSIIRVLPNAPTLAYHVFSVRSEPDVEMVDFTIEGPDEPPMNTAHLEGFLPGAIRGGGGAAQTTAISLYANHDAGTDLSAGGGSLKLTRIKIAKAFYFGVWGLAGCTNNNGGTHTMELRNCDISAYLQPFAYYANYLNSPNTNTYLSSFRTLRIYNCDFHDSGLSIAEDTTPPTINLTTGVRNVLGSGLSGDIGHLLYIHVNVDTEITGCRFWGMHNDTRYAIHFNGGSNITSASPFCIISDCVFQNTVGRVLRASSAIPLTMNRIYAYCRNTIPSINMFQLRNTSLISQVVVDDGGNSGTIFNCFSVEGSESAPYVSISDCTIRVTGTAIQAKNAGYWKIYGNTFQIPYSSTVSTYGVRNDGVMMDLYDNTFLTTSGIGGKAGFAATNPNARTTARDNTFLGSYQDAAISIGDGVAYLLYNHLLCDASVRSIWFWGPTTDASRSIYGEGNEFSATAGPFETTAGLYGNIQLRDSWNPTTLASAASLVIDRNHRNHHVSGTATISNIYLHTNTNQKYLAGWKARITLVADGAWKFTTGGNIQPKSTDPRAVGQVIVLELDPRANSGAGVWREI